MALNTQVAGHTWLTSGVEYCLQFDMCFDVLTCSLAWILSKLWSIIYYQAHANPP